MLTKAGGVQGINSAVGTTEHSGREVLEVATGQGGDAFRRPFQIGKDDADTVLNGGRAKSRDQAGLFVCFEGWGALDSVVVEV
jgi:hypothetical protein